MKKKSRFIFVQLGLQAVILGLVFIPVMFDLSSPFTEIGPIGTYALAVLSGIFITYGILVLFSGQPREVLGRGAITGLWLWGIMLPLFLALCDGISSRNHKRAVAEGYKTESLKAISQMGLSGFTWDPRINRYRISPGNGMEHSFYAMDDVLYLSCKVHVPEAPDTLAWLRLCLNEASPYLSRYAYSLFDSCIRAGRYTFRDLRPGADLSLSSAAPADKGIWMLGKTCYDEKFWGNICLMIPFDERTIRRATPG